MLLIIKQNKNTKEKKVINVITSKKFNKGIIEELTILVKKDNRTSTTEEIIERVRQTNYYFREKKDNFIRGISTSEEIENEYKRFIDFYISEALRHNDLRLHTSSLEKKFFKQNLFASTKTYRYFVYACDGDFNDKEVRNNMEDEIISLYAIYLHNRR